MLAVLCIFLIPCSDVEGTQGIWSPWLVFFYVSNSVGCCGTVGMVAGMILRMPGAVFMLWRMGMPPAPF